MELAIPRMKVSAVAALLLLLLAVAGALLGARPAGAADELHVVTGPGGRLVVFDPDGDGLRLGDRVTFRDPLLDATGTDRVGTSTADCIVVRAIHSDAPTGLWRCSYVLALPDGDLVIEGMDPAGAGVYQMAVIGGTESYASATGDATFTDAPNPAETAIYTDMVIHLAA